MTMKHRETREEILRVQNLKQHFKSGFGKNKIVVKAVDDISFSIYKGEVFSLVGESGCGKTTTGRTIIKLYEATGGEVFFHGQRIQTDLTKAQEQFKAGEISQEDFLQAKRDKKFEKYVDPSQASYVRSLTDDAPEFSHIHEKYNIRLKELSALEAKLLNKKDSGSLDSETLAELNEELKSVQNELGLIDKRRRLDIQHHKRELTYQNKFLMRKMQMIFQDPIASLNPRMTVKEIIAEGLRINGMKNEAEIDRRVKEALKIVGLVPEHASRYPHEFSGGQRQRIGIARALIVDPTFIIADEPISALDVSIRAQVINLLNDLRENQGITIMFIAHDLSVVKYFSDRVAVMYFGKIVEIGDKDKIFNNPLHPYTLSLIDAIPLPDPKYEQARGALKRYNPQTQHNYSETEPPQLREVEPGHVVLCNMEEYEKYRSQIAQKK
jgi:oligopeptide transport system ATP-binding protein